MSEAICPGAARPLPGVVKLYLLQLYPLTLALLCCRVILAAISFEIGPEPFIWSLGAFVLGLGGLAVIVGLHARSAWSPQLASRLNIGLCLFLAALALRLLLSSLFEYMSYYGSEVMVMVIPAMLAFNIPFFLGWAIYFASSANLRLVIPQATYTETELPPLGVALTRILSASLLSFYALLAITFVRANSDFILFKILFTTAALPVAISITLLLFSGRNNRASQFTTALLVSGGLMCVWSSLSYAMSFIIFGEDFDYSIITIYYNLKTIPLAPLIFGLALALLGWKVWANPREQSWFKDGHTAVRSPRILTTIFVVQIYYISIVASQIIFQLLSGWGERVTQTDTIISGGAVGAVALGLAAVYADQKAKKDARILGLTFFAASAALSLVAACLVLYQQEYHFFILRIIQIFAIPVAVGLIGIRAVLEEYGTSRRIFGGANPTISVFILFSLLLMVGGLWEGISDSVSVLFGPEDGYWRRTDSYPVLGLLLNFEFWMAYLICPVIVIRSLRGGIKSFGKFYALCAVWLFSIIGSIISKLIKTVVVGDIGGLGMMDITNPIYQVYVYGIVLFIIYLVSTRQQGRCDETDRLLPADEPPSHMDMGVE